MEEGGDFSTGGEEVGLFFVAEEEVWVAFCFVEEGVEFCADGVRVGAE